VPGNRHCGEDLLNQTDEAMYVAKTDGKDQYAAIRSDPSTLRSEGSESTGSVRH